MSASLPVSVVIPAHDAADRLEATLRSALAQDVDGLEIVVVDDGSTDGTAELARSVAPDAVVHRQSQAGAGAARNTGTSLARGDVLMFLDADDLWPLDVVRHRLELLADERTEVITGRFTSIDDAFGAELDRFTAYEPEAWWTFLLGACAIRRAAWDRVGLFDPTIFPGEDTDWYLRAREAGVRIHRDEHSTLLYRQHPESGVHVDRARQKRVLFANIRRHRERVEGTAP